MKILVVSDTHGYTSSLRTLLGTFENQVDMVIHLGDYAQDLLDMEILYPNLTMVAVAGAVDYGVDSVRILKLEGCRIMLLHGHLHGVKSDIRRLIKFAKDSNVDACLFGHTHVQTMFTQESIFFMNPGSIPEPRDGSGAGYGLIEITPEGEISGEIITL